MNAINFNQNSIKNGLSAAASCIAQNFVRFRQYTVRNISQIPESMHTKLPVSIAVIGLSNLIFLGVMKKIAQPHFENTQNSTKTKRTFNYICLNTLLGACAYQFNLWLSKTTRYALSPQIILAVSVNFVSAHMIWNLISRSPSTSTPTTHQIVQKSSASNKKDELNENKAAPDEDKEVKSYLTRNKWKQLFTQLLKSKEDDKVKSPDAPKAPDAPPTPGSPLPPPPPPPPPVGPSLGPDLTLLDNILLENEPTEPVLADMKAKGDSPNQILAKIQEYIEGLKKARLPLQNMLDKKEELVKKKKELETDISTKQKTITELEKMVKILSNKEDVTFIDVRIDKNLHLMPLYSDKQWEAINKTFKDDDDWGDFKPLTKFYKKSAHLAYIQNEVDIAKLKAELEQDKQAKKNCIDDLNSIENKKHGSINFNDFGNVLINKNKKLTKWLATELQYKKMTTPKPADKPTPNPIAKVIVETKSKAQEFADNHHNLKLKEWANLQDYQNFLLVVNNPNAELGALQDLFVLNET